MNILIALGSITPNDDANSNIAKLIAGELVKEGHTVTLLGMSFWQCTPEECIEGITYHRILNLCPPKRKQCNDAFAKATTRGEKMKLLLRHPLWFAGMCLRYVRGKLFDFKEALYVREFRKLLKKELFDRVIVITAPFYVATALMRTKTRIPTVWYQLDPNQSNHTAAYRGKKDLLKKEKQWYRFIEYAVVPKLVYRENQKNALSEFLYKMQSANFPNVRKLAFNPETDIPFRQEDINLVFTGTFYEDIRNPLPLFEIVSRFQHPHIKLHIIGGGCLDLLEEWSRKCASIIYHGYQPAAFAENAMLFADVLVNVDNLAGNMLPSKINDYISTGKPILNLYPLDQSACAEYLENYNFHLNVSVKDGVTDRFVETVERFCLDNKGKTKDFVDIVCKYRESTPEFVAGLLLKGRLDEKIQ